MKIQILYLLEKKSTYKETCVVQIRAQGSTVLHVLPTVQDRKHFISDQTHQLKHLISSPVTKQVEECFL